MTKTELRKSITRMRKELLALRQGKGESWEYDNFNALESRNEIAKKYIQELENKGLSKTDHFNIQAYRNEYFKAGRMFEQKIFGWN